MVIKIFNECTENCEVVNSIEGSVASNYLFIISCVKTRIWRKKISKRFLKNELIFVETFSIGITSIFYYFLVGFLKKN